MNPNPDVLAAGRALEGNELAKAESLLQARLTTVPNDVEALRLMASVAAAAGHLDDAEQLLRRAIRLSPEFVLAYVDLASLLCRLERADAAIALLDHEIATQQRNVWALSLKAGILAAERRVEEALDIHEALVNRVPGASVLWTNYGQALQAVGRVEEAITTYRRSLQIDPTNGFAWLGLANLRTVRLRTDDIASLQHALSACTDKLQLVQLHFALGKALGDHGKFELSFHHYEQANKFRQNLIPYDASITRDIFHRVETVFAAEFLARNANVGCDAPDPIFIIGMPRSGSSLVEQILASHPMVEGCGELFELRNLLADLGVGPGSAWPEVIADLSADELQALGQRYLASTRRHRRTDRPYFTDKMPSNWQFIGLIHLILPNAKIIDVRRHPLACCFSAFTTYFNLETRFPTDLKDLGRYFADYVRMTVHFEATRPGKIHRVQHERLVADFEGEVGRLLDYLHLPFDAACLRFHENPRTVHTPSAQQVRRPINSEGLEFWRNYESWLDPLKDALDEGRCDWRGGA